MAQCVAHRCEPVSTHCVACSYPACVIVGRHIGSGTARQLPQEQNTPRKIPEMAIKRNFTLYNTLSELQHISSRSILLDAMQCLCSSCCWFSVSHVAASLTDLHVYVTEVPDKDYVYKCRGESDTAASVLPSAVLLAGSPLVMLLVH